MAQKDRPAWRHLLFAMEAALVVVLLAWAAFIDPLVQMLRDL